MFGIEEVKCHQTEFLQNILERRLQSLQTIEDASAQIDRGGLAHVPARYRKVSDPESKVSGLEEDLRIEDKSI